MFVAAVLSTVTGVMSALAGAGATSAAAKYNAKVARANAKMARGEADLELGDKAREMRRTLGTMRAAYGASGIDFSGSPLDVLADTSSEFAWDIAKIQYKGEVRAVNQENQAMLDDMEAKSARTAGFIGAGAALFSGLGKIAGYSDFGRDLSPAA